MIIWHSMSKEMVSPDCLQSASASEPRLENHYRSFDCAATFFVMFAEEGFKYGTIMLGRSPYPESPIRQPL